MKNTTKILFVFSFCYFLYFPDLLFAQHYTRTDTIPVKANGNWLKNPWVGGHNFCQFSDIDLNSDGIKDLFVFDRTGHKVTTYINQGTANTVGYIDSTSKYGSHFPHLEDWVLLRDFNCDGKPDIFSYSNGGIKVWKNISTIGNPQFTLQAPYLKSSYCPSLLNLSVTGADIPTIDDIDGDGDLDILTYDAGGINMQYHMNQSKELGYGCDSLLFKMDCSGCWGNYRASISGCNMVLGSCRMINPDSTGKNATTEEHHAGNCSLCMDIDGDGDKDILLGQLGCCNMTLLTNGGSAASANMVSMDDSFPSYNIPAILANFPCGYFLDLNNDGKRDLIVSPNAPNVSVNNESIWYYLNTGSDSIPVFSRQTRSFLQKEMIDAGEGADPVFFDFNNDGLTDLLISNYSMAIDSCPSTNLYGVLAFQNIGSSTSPKFDLVNSDYANLSTQLPSTGSKHLTFGDVDADGDPDMYVGDYDGFIHYFKNVAATGNPASFTNIGLVADASSSTLIDVGSYSTPQLVDVDRDGDLDLIIGERAGNINYYKNVGTAASASFSLITTSFGGVDVFAPCCTGYSIPFMYDSAGSYRLVVGSEANRSSGANLMGWIWKFKNIDGNLGGSFTVVDSTYENIWEGTRMSVNGRDINNDGSMDLVIGNYAGGVAIYLGDTTTLSVSELGHPHFDFSIYPNPSKGEISITFTNLAPNEKFELAIYDILGEKVLFTKGMSNGRAILIDASPLPAGIYSCEIKSVFLQQNGSGSSRLSKKLILIK